jgi:hypothetical protein
LEVWLAVGSQQSAVGSWQSAVGSWQLAVGSWQLAVKGGKKGGKILLKILLEKCQELLR